MSGGRPPRRTLSEDELRLWQAVAAAYEPLDKAGRQAGEAQPAPTRPRPVAPVVAPLPARPGRRPVEPGGKPATAGGTPASPPPAGLDSRKTRRLAKGHIPIEARLDLHGMRQHEAHLALRRFLLAAQAQGLRHVKVITGKGKAAETDGEAGQPFDLYDDRQRGVLRRLVPVWLAEPELRAVVAGYGEAGRGHGGGGALYIHLRKPAQARGRE